MVEFVVVLLGVWYVHVCVCMKRMLGVLLCHSTLLLSDKTDPDPGARLAVSKPQPASCLRPHSAGSARR